jgi:RecB family exonuclease
VLRARLARRPEGEFEGQLNRLAETLGLKFGPEAVWSPSRLETFANCGYSFFAGEALRLERRDPPSPGFDYSQAGSMLHDVLEQVYQQAADPASAASVLEALPEVARHVFDTAPERLGFRPSALWEMEKAELMERLTKTVAALAAEWDVWRPLRHEELFGFDDQTLLEMDTPAGPVRLRGRIDRIDVGPDGTLRVIDYKRSISNQTKGELVSGVQLQLPLYALAAEQALRLGSVSDGFYWAIRDARAGKLRLKDYQPSAEDDEGPGGVAASIRVAAGHTAAAVTGVREGRFAPVPPKGACPDYCPAFAFCWRARSAKW